jgi:hypothetical protein
MQDRSKEPAKPAYDPLIASLEMAFTNVDVVIEVVRTWPAERRPHGLMETLGGAAAQLQLAIDALYARPRE